MPGESIAHQQPCTCVPERTVRLCLCVAGCNAVYILKQQYKTSASTLTAYADKRFILCNWLSCKGNCVGECQHYASRQVTYLCTCGLYTSFAIAKTSLSTTARHSLRRPDLMVCSLKY